MTVSKCSQFLYFTGLGCRAFQAGRVCNWFYIAQLFVFRKYLNTHKHTHTPLLNERMRGLSSLWVNVELPSLSSYGLATSLVRGCSGNFASLMPVLTLGALLPSTPLLGLVVYVCIASLSAPLGAPSGLDWCSLLLGFSRLWVRTAPQEVLGRGLLCKSAHSP